MSCLSRPLEKRRIKPTERDWPWRPFYEIVIIVTPFLRQEVMRKKKFKERSNGNMYLPDTLVNCDAGLNGEEKNWTRYKMKVIFSRFKTKANRK